MRILGSYSIKGGVGKTSMAVNLAYLAAEGGERTLLWDLDPQGASTFYLRVKPKVRGGARKLVLGKSDPLARVRGSDFEGLDLLPADRSYRHLDVILHDAKKPRQRLVRLLQRLEEEYDRVVLDCPPGLSLTTEAMFTAADLLIIPSLPNALSLRTLETLGDHFRQRRARGRSVPDALPVFSMVDRRKLIHLQHCAAPPREPFRFSSTMIPFSSAVEKMELRRAPLVSFDSRSPPAIAYRALWREIRARERT